MRTCPKCNYKIQNVNAKFCKNCGARLGDLPVEESRDNTMSMHSSKDGGIVLTPDSSSDDSRRRGITPVAPNRPSQPEFHDLDIKPHDHTDLVINRKKSTTKGTNKGMMWYVKTCFKKYATFKGRASRSEYWYFVLFNNLIIIIPVILAFVIDHNVVSPILCVAAFIYMLAVCIPGLAVSVRRLHDIGKSGAYYFISFIPYIGAFILLYYFCKAGDKSVNLYGEQP